MNPVSVVRVRKRSRSMHRALLGVTLALGMGAWLPAAALLQTSNDRTPTWTMFKVRAMGDQERGAFFAVGALCVFPEQYPPKRPNPRWETERPSRPHFVEHLNPAFIRCVFRPFVAMPEFYDPKIPVEYEFEFEKQVPRGFEPHRTGERSARVLTNLADGNGGRLEVPDLAGSPDQQVVLRFSIFGKRLSEIGFRIDNRYTLQIREFDRAAADKPPYVLRQWGTP